MQKQASEAINCLAPSKNTYQLVEIKEIEKYCPESDVLIYGLKSEKDVKKAASSLLPYFPLEQEIDVLKDDKKTSITLADLSQGKGVKALFVRAIEEKDKFGKLVKIISRLRSPDGCPWDLEQSPDTIKGHLIEEAYEVVDTINRGDFEHFKEELGDLLLQVVLHSQMASQCSRFTLDDVLREINEKLIRRHPHVFASVKAKLPSQVLAEWEKIKKSEKEKESYMDGVAMGLPSLLFAQKLQTKAARVGFDWLKAEEVLDKLDEEVEEFKKAKDLSREEQESELGDILFAVVNYGRKVGIDAESALLKSAEKFKLRFQKMEELARRQGKDFASLSLQEKEKLWEKAKKEDD